MLKLERVVDIDEVRAPGEDGASDTEPQSMTSKYDCGICGLPVGETLGDGVAAPGRKVCVESDIELRFSNRENLPENSEPMVYVVPWR